MDGPHAGGRSDGLLCRWRERLHAGPGGPARFTCGGVEYITLREAVPRDAVGRKLGDIQTLAAVDGEGRVVDTCGVTLSFSALARLEERLPEGGRTVQVLNVWALPARRTALWP